MMTLSRYLEENSVSQDAFAQRVKVKQATVSRLVRNSIRPSLDLAVRIEVETCGAVPAVSWVSSDADPQQEVA
jgi:plasmid maintenance system antidote protein VapI